jgi:outer membrane lipoprotein-sorting protein
MRLFPMAMAAALLFAAAPARADGAEDVARRMLAHDVFGFEGTRLSARLVLTTDGGEKQERAFSALSKKREGLSTVVRFTAPSQVAGTAFLMIQHDGQADEQWVYLPRMRTTRRIGAGGERDGSFMGSDFTYADMERRDLRDATYSLAGEETIGHDACQRLEVTPRASNAYSRILVWVRDRDGMPLRVQWFGTDGQLSKTLFARRVGTVDGRAVITESHTENARTHHATDLVVDDLAFDPDIDDAEFTPAALSH